MSDVQSYLVFAETVAAGSMSGAARRLGLTPSAVSQIIAGLERRSGVTLLHRSTRKLTLTEAGARCYPHCLRLLEARQAASASLEQARAAPSGTLRIAAPIGFGAFVAPALAPMLAEWTGVRLRLIVDDALTDLREGRIDLALRVGWTNAAGWTTRQLCEVDMILCAAPSYLGRHGHPAAPGDLDGHRGIGIDRTPRVHGVGNDVDDDLPMVSLLLHDAGGRSEQVRLPLHVATTSQIASQQLCEQGMGIARLSYADVRSALDGGLLVRVLPHWRLASRPVTMMTRDRGLPAKVNIAAAALQRFFLTFPRTGVGVKM